MTHGIDSDAGRDWGQEEKGTTEDEMAGWHHRADAHVYQRKPDLTMLFLSAFWIVYPVMAVFPSSLGGQS